MEFVSGHFQQIREHLVAPITEKKKTTRELKRHFNWWKACKVRIWWQILHTINVLPLRFCEDQTMQHNEVLCCLAARRKIGCYHENKTRKWNNVQSIPPKHSESSVSQKNTSSWASRSTFSISPSWSVAPRHCKMSCKQSYLQGHQHKTVKKSRLASNLQGLLHKRRTWSKAIQSWYFSHVTKTWHFALKKNLANLKFAGQNVPSLLLCKGLSVLGHADTMQWRFVSGIFLVWISSKFIQKYSEKKGQQHLRWESKIRIKLEATVVAQISINHREVSGYCLCLAGLVHVIDSTFRTNTPLQTWQVSVSGQDLALAKPFPFFLNAEPSKGTNLISLDFPGLCFPFFWTCIFFFLFFFCGVGKLTI